MYERVENKDREPLPGAGMRSGRYSQDNTEGFFCKFTFGQFFALLVIEVFTIFFVFYLGARFGPKLLGFNKSEAIIVGAGTENTAKETKVMTTDDPEIAALTEELVAKAKTPELKERLTQMLKPPQEDKGVPLNQQSAVTENVELKKEELISANSEKTEETSENAPAQNSLDDVDDNDETRGMPPDEPISEEPKQKAPAENNQMPMRQASSSKEVEKGAVRIKSADGAKYALQIGSYQQLGEANTIVEQWKGRGYPAYMMIADIPDRGRWYRVRLGSFASRDEAQKYKKDFEGMEKKETIIVMNEQ